MLSHSTDDSTLAATRRSELLQELVKVACNGVNAQLDALITRLSDAMLNAAQAQGEPPEARRCMNAAALLKKNRYPFYYVVSERISALLQHEIALIEESASMSRDSSGALATLPPDLEIDKKLCLLKAARALESEHADSLNALRMRLVGLLERDDLSAAGNPFRPHIFLSVLHDAWCEFQPGTDSHHLVYRLLGPDLCLDMGPILHALNTVLIRRGVPAKLTLSLDVEQTDEGEQDMPKASAQGDPVLRELGRLFPRDAMSSDKPLAGDFPMLFEGDAFLRYLDNHPAAVAIGPQPAPLLADLKREAPQGSLTRADEHTIDLVAKIFDMVFGDPHIPHDVKGEIGSLQLPLLKEALRDKDFFFRYAHPARYVIDMLGTLGLARDGQKGDADPAFQVIRRNVARIREEAGRRFTVYADVAADLDAFMQREATASAVSLSSAIERALQQEKQMEVTRAAKHEVALRVGTGEIVAFVETFLEDKWVPVLTLAYAAQEQKPQAVQSAIGTMDDLVWSVKPKITAAERKELVAKLPNMVAMLNKWLDLIKWNDEERTRFFTELARCHASIVRAPLELSPERQMQIALAVAKHAAERRAQRLARQHPEPEADAYTRQVQKITSGTWIRFARKDGSVFKLRLAWISPMRNIYIFATRERQEAFSLTAEQFAETLREQHAHLLPAAGLVGRALADALGVESANADGMVSAA